MDERIKSVMAAVFGVDHSAITEEASVDVIKNWDSLRHMNLILALEEEFGVNFNDEDIPDMTNFQVIRSVLSSEVSR